MTDDLWTIRAALEWTEGYLARKGDKNPRLSAQWLLAEATSLRRIELYTHFEQPLSLEERDILRDFVSRRGRGEPLQYIVGEVGFRHIVVKVDSGVLIPRPETEVLVSEALALLPSPPRSCATDSRQDSGRGEVVLSVDFPAENILVSDFSLDRDTALEDASAKKRNCLLVADICTGSGCIACSLAFEHPAVQVIATDSEPQAVMLARKNIAALSLEERVEVIQCDLGAGIDECYQGSFDLVVANPPYIPTEEVAKIPSEVSAFEPLIALDGGQDGLQVFRRLLLWCVRACKPGAGVAFELHETCLDAAAEYAASLGFVDIRIVSDLAGRPRVLVARKNLEAV